jgi:hypothetical protein
MILKAMLFPVAHGYEESKHEDEEEWNEEKDLTPSVLMKKEATIDTELHNKMYRCE